jgi:hypothetical protein
MTTSARREQASRGAGTWDAARKMLRRVDELDLKHPLRPDDVRYRKHHQKLTALCRDVSRLLGTKWMADWEREEVKSRAEMEPNEFERLRIILRGIQAAARRAPKLIE